MRDLDRSAQETLELAVERHHPSLVMACSFQKEESVLIDLLMQIEPQARVFTIDTGVLFAETYATWRALGSIRISMSIRTDSSFWKEQAMTRLGW